MPFSGDVLGVETLLSLPRPGEDCFGGVRLPNCTESSGVTGVLRSLLLLLIDDLCFILSFLCIMYGSDEGDIHLLKLAL